MAQNNTRKLESRTARIEIIGIGDPATAKEGKLVLKSVDGIYLRSESPSWAETAVHYFRNEKTGETFGVWGSATLDKGLATVPAETYTQLEFQGMRKTPKGNDMKVIDVRVPQGTPVLNPGAF